MSGNRYLEKKGKEGEGVAWRVCGPAFEGVQEALESERGEKGETEKEWDAKTSEASASGVWLD